MILFICVFYAQIIQYKNVGEKNILVNKQFIVL